jgi:hypothetical protein
MQRLPVTLWVQTEQQIIRSMFGRKLRTLLCGGSLFIRNRLCKRVISPPAIDAADRAQPEQREPAVEPLPFCRLELNGTAQRTFPPHPEQSRNYRWPVQPCAAHIDRFSCGATTSLHRPRSNLCPATQEVHGRYQWRGPRTSLPLRNRDESCHHLPRRSGRMGKPHP